MTADDWKSCSLSAPAKVNLGLRVEGVRPDGYHLIDSLFVPLDLADLLTLRTRPAGSPAAEVDFILEGTPPGVPADRDNLAARAARAFVEASGLALRVEVRLQKQIPAGAGLGGGSSDAAAVLRALDRLHPGRVSPQSLRELALAIGADVPFFLDPKPARVRGIGEQIQAIPGLPALALVLANPGVSLATAAVYAEFDRQRVALTPARSRPTLPPLAGQGTEVRSAAVLKAWLTGGQLQNDLEAAAVSLCPVIRQLAGELTKAGALAVGMSGSGATVFGVFPDAESAEAGLSKAALGSPNWARVAATVGSR